MCVLGGCVGTAIPEFNTLPLMSLSYLFKILNKIGNLILEEISTRLYYKLCRMATSASDWSTARQLREVACLTRISVDGLIQHSGACFYAVTPAPTSRHLDLHGAALYLLKFEILMSQLFCRSARGPPCFGCWGQLSIDLVRVNER